MRLFIDPLMRANPVWPKPVRTNFRGGRTTKVESEPPIVDQPQEGVGERLCISRWKEQGRATMSKNLCWSTHIGCRDCHPPEHPFENDHPERFVPASVLHQDFVV